MKETITILPDSYITSKDHVTRVMGQLPNDECFDIDRKEKILSSFQKGKGYIDPSGKYIWIYNPYKPANSNELPNVWPEDIDEDYWHFVYSHPSDVTMETYSFDNICVMNLNRIDETITGDEKLYDQDTMLSIYSSTASFIPEINKNDDGLKQLIKKYINTTHVDVAAFKTKLKENYSLSNMKAALMNKTKMSIKYFNMWNELFGTTYVIAIKDKFGNIVEYNSDTDEATAYKQEIKQLRTTKKDEN